MNFTGELLEKVITKALGEDIILELNDSVPKRKKLGEKLNLPVYDSYNTEIPNDPLSFCKK